jgi:hypothetical protein
LPPNRAARLDDAPGVLSQTGSMSGERDELMRLVQELPEDQVPDVLADVRRHLRPVKDRPWPPAFFASAPGDGTSIAERSEELLRDGFGQ